MPRIADIPHLERRPSGFFWRRRLPRAMLRHDATEFFLVVSLRTHVPSDAKSRAGRLTALSDTVFAWATETGMIDPDLATRLLKALARFEIEADEAARAVAPPRSQADVEMALARESAVQETLRRALMLNDREAARAPLRAVAARLGVALEEDDDDWKRLAWRATRVLLEASAERARRETGSYGAERPGAADHRGRRRLCRAALPGLQDLQAEGAGQSGGRSELGNELEGQCPIDGPAHGPDAGRQALRPDLGRRLDEGMGSDRPPAEHLPVQDLEAVSAGGRGRGGRARGAQCGADPRAAREGGRKPRQDRRPDRHGADPAHACRDGLAPTRRTRSRRRRRLQPVPVARAMARRAMCIS